MKSTNGCTCDECRDMCKRPCWGSPADIRVLIAAGLGHRLMLDYWVGGSRHEGEEGYEHSNDIHLICPAEKGRESKSASFWPSTGCTFLTADGLCELHDKDLKPTEACVAIHSDRSGAQQLHHDMAELWNNDEGEALVSEWIDFTERR